MATGDLTSRIEVQSKDETGLLLQALKDMNASSLWKDSPEWMGHRIDSTTAVRYSALFPKFEADAMIAMIEHEPLGEDDVADLLLLNFKGADFVGHPYGPDSNELRLTLAEMDRNLARIIGALEAATLRGVGYTLAPADFARMRALDDEMKAAVAARDFDRYYAANLAFHDVYLSRSDNARLVAQVHLLKQRLYDWPRRHTMMQAWEQHSVVEHEDFLALLEHGNIDAAADHLQHVHWSFTVQERYVRAYYFAGNSATPDDTPPAAGAHEP